MAFAVCMLLLLLLLVLLAPFLACFHCRQAFCQRPVLRLLETLMWRLLLLQHMLSGILTERLLQSTGNTVLLLRLLLLLLWLRQLEPWCALNVLVSEHVRQGTCRLPAQLQHQHKDRNSSSSIQPRPQAYQSAC